MYNRIFMFSVELEELLVRVQVVYKDSARRTARSFNIYTPI